MSTRRAFLLSGAAAAGGLAEGEPASIPAEVIRKHDDSAERQMAMQVVEAGSRWRGALRDAVGLHNPGQTGQMLAAVGTGFLYEGSRLFHRTEAFARMKLAVEFLNKCQSPDGNFDLIVTNFNSPPDTGFMVEGLASMARLAKQTRNNDVLSLVMPILDRCGAGLARGGVHTPNHRWVVSAALAQLNELQPRPEYVKRIDQWLAEGVDIDSDGQYTERSTTVYNTVVDRAMVVMAHKLNRPQLLDPVRRNLDSLQYLMHPGDEVVTEISRRQDQYTRGNMHGYWFAAQYLAVRDGNGRYASIAAKAAPHAASLPMLIEYPELRRTVAPEALPEDFEKALPGLDIVRIRRGSTSVTLSTGGGSRFLNLRRGKAVVAGVRFASAFFGKGQFAPKFEGKRDGAYVFTQQLRAGYYQPLEPSRTVAAGEWGNVRRERRESEVCTLTQEAIVREERDGLSVRLRSHGTRDVPLAIEIAFAPGGQLIGCEAVKGEGDAYLMNATSGSYSFGGDTIHFGPMLREHGYVNVRGAEARLPGQQTVYLTALTPLDYTLRFQW